MRNYQIAILTTILTAGVAAPPAIGQTANPVPYGATSYSATDQVTTIGHVVSSSRHTIMIRQNETGLYQLFIIANDAVRPQGKIPEGSGITIISSPGDDPDVRVAHFIALSNLPPPPPATSPSTVPQSMQRLDREIQRAARAWNVGLYTGFSLDSELVLFGINARFGPIFGDIYFRPGFEFGLGEVSRAFTINLEGVYRLPVTNRLGPWSTYVGAGPTLSWDCLCGHGPDDFSFNAGLNVFMGMQWRKGMFIEGKATVWSTPHLRLMVGYTF